MQLCNQNIDNFDLYYFLENEKQANKHKKSSKPTWSKVY